MQTTQTKTTKTSDDIRRELEARIAILDQQPIDPELEARVALREAVANHLFEIMERQGVTQAELARRLGRSRAYVSRLLGGGANLTLETLALVGQALNCCPEVKFTAIPRQGANCTLNGADEEDEKRSSVELAA